MILIDPKSFYYSDQETPVDLAVIGYSVNLLDQFKDMMLNRW